MTQIMIAPEIKVKVNRSRAPQEALDATNRVKHTDRKVVDAMPKGEGDEVEVCFFKPEAWEYTSPGFMSDDDLSKALERRNLKDDPMAVIAVNEADPTFADEKPHGTHWKDAKGNWCYAAFHSWGGRREVNVYRNDLGWSGSWWLAGVFVSSPQH
jgi:hypothetical protein